MLFKQIQLFHLPEASQYTAEVLDKLLEQLAFRPCLPSMSMSVGWVPPLDEDESLVNLFADNLTICLQVEEKILPATVVRQELDAKIKQIELAEGRKIRSKEKLALKEELTLTLLPRAFTKLARIYAYIDTRNNWLVVDTTNTKKLELFMANFKKSISDNVRHYDLKKSAPIMTHWLKNQDYPSVFSIEKASVLQDPDRKNRIIRCQQQDLFANGIQSLLNDGCEVVQLALSWNDQVNFVLCDQLSLRRIQFQDELIAQAQEMEAETKRDQFIADFLIMSGTFEQLFNALLTIFKRSEDMETVKHESKMGAIA